VSWFDLDILHGRRSLSSSLHERKLVAATARLQVKDLGLPSGWKGWNCMAVISGSCRAGKRYPDSVSAAVSVPHLVDGPKLVSTAMKSDEGPATGANSVSGRAISGSGRVANPGLSAWTSARTTRSTSDRPACD